MGVRGKYASGGGVALIVLMLMSLFLGGCNNVVHGAVYRVGFLSGSPVFDTTMEGLQSGLEELGYQEGDLIYEFQAAQGDYERMRAIARDFAASGMDVIFTTTNDGALAAKEAVAGSDVPVVFSFVIAPVETGVVDSLRHPGGNLTGVRNPLDVFIGKRVEFAQWIVPDLKRVWVPYNPQYPTLLAVLNQLRSAASILEVALVESQVSSQDDVLQELSRFDQMEAPPFDAIIIFPDPTVQRDDSWQAILTFANEHHLPILANTSGQVEEGALLGYLTDNVATGRQAAHLVDLVLRGRPPAELPVETAEQYLFVNLPVAESLGYTVPDVILRQAARVIRGGR